LGTHVRVQIKLAQEWVAAFWGIDEPAPVIEIGYCHIVHATGHAAVFRCGHDRDVDDLVEAADEPAPMALHRVLLVADAVERVRPAGVEIEIAPDEEA